MRLRNGWGIDMDYERTEERFLKDVAEHQMTVIRDDGVHRHIRFKRPGSSAYFFDLITWPGCLCYTGDMGTYVFRRIEDMFEFFRADREYNQRHGRKLSINTGYWAEKVEAQDRNDGLTEFDEERFDRIVLETLVTWLREHRHETTKDDRRDLWEAVVDEVVHADGDSGGHRKQCAAFDFHHRVNRELEFYFQDFWENRLTRYTLRFVWCCYALAWGIQQYDELKRIEVAA